MMPYARFLVFNVMGALVWAGVMVSLAYFAGRFVPLSVLIHYTLQFGLIFLTIVVGWFILPWLKKYPWFPFFQSKQKS
jgi:membrane-associated protein